VPNPKAAEQVPEAFVALLNRMTGDTSDNPEHLKSLKAALDKIIDENPDFGMAFTTRAAIACNLNLEDRAQLDQDIEAALKYSKKEQRPFLLYAMKAKLALQAGDLSGAVDFLGYAIQSDVGLARSSSLAGSEFNSGIVAPGAKEERCAWNKSDFDALVARRPTDYLPPLFRGLYKTAISGSSGDQKAIEEAASDFNRAAALNPKSPLPPYFLGGLYDGASSSYQFTHAIQDTYRQKALAAYDRALQIEPGMAQALRDRAELRWSMGQTALALRDYDRALEVDSKDAATYNNRGKLKFGLKDYYGAISDFSGALRSKEVLGDVDLSNVYSDRADAYIHTGSYQRALQDLTECIRINLSIAVYSWSLDEFRTAYPEYADIADRPLSEKLHALFYPDLPVEVFRGHIENNQTNAAQFLLQSLYAKRADTNLKIGDYRHALTDYRRACKGFGESHLDRWLLVLKTGGDDLYIDSQTVEYPHPETAKFWVKTIATTAKQGGASTVQSYEINCDTRALNSNSFQQYDTSGKLIASSDLPTGWKSVVPDTVGEQLYSGFCK